MPFPQIGNITATQNGVSGTIARAANAAGVDFDYLFAQAGVESSFDPRAEAKTSSASGLFQFTEQTWLGMIDRHGAKHGYGWAADSIRQGSDGRYHVSDPSARRQILNLRFDPEASSMMAGEFAGENRTHLRSRLGWEPESVDLYLAHFLGAGGAGKFLSRWSANPDASAAPLFPKAAAANRSIFYDAGGAPRSLGEIRTLFDRKLANAGANPAMMAAGINAPYDSGLAMGALDSNGLGFNAYPVVTPAPRYLDNPSFSPASRQAAAPPQSKPSDHMRPLSMQEIVPMPRRLSVDFARSVYERFSGPGSELG